MTDEEIMKKLQSSFSTRHAGIITIENGLVSCTGSILLGYDKITKLPVKFKSVDASFNCANNQLNTLAGAPQTVGGNFDCTNNQLFSLRGAPQSVGGNFTCTKNLLTSLRGAPQSVSFGFYCLSNQLESLTGAPQSLISDFDCGGNQLTSLRGAPRYVGKDFRCIANPLTSLTGAPQYVGNVFYLTYAKNLALLPLLMIKGCKGVVFSNANYNMERISLSEILNRYLGTGTQGMLACAEEMIEAGYGSNAHYD